MRVRASAKPGGVLVVTWNASKDASGIARYEIRATAPRQKLKTARATGSAKSATLRGLKRRTTWTIQIRAMDRAGNVSRWATIRLRTR